MPLSPHASCAVTAAALALTSFGASPTAASAQNPVDTAALLAAARELPGMPEDNFGFRQLIGATTDFTIAAGGPFNDLAWTLYDTDYIDGETAGFDVFCPVDPGDEAPGAGEIKYVLTTTNTLTDEFYGSQNGDRIILGHYRADGTAVPYFLDDGAGGAEDDYVIIRHFDYRAAVVELVGDTSDYALLAAGPDEGVVTEGYYLFHVGDASGAPDLVAFFFPCDETDSTRPDEPGTPPMPGPPLCNADSTLSLTRAYPGRPYGAFVFREADDFFNTPAEPLGITQFGGPGKEMPHGQAVDEEGAVYLFGATDSNLDGGADAENELFVAKILPDGSRAWVTELAQPEGALLWDGDVDEDFVYAAGRTLGALPGFRNAGGWDGIILKLDRNTGEIVASDQWGNVGLDGYGNLVLDDADGLFVSGAGSPVGQRTGDSAYVVAKHRRSDLENVWRRLDPAEPTAERVSEAWAGLTYAPGDTPGDGRLVAGGWFISTRQPPGGANGFVTVYEDLTAAEPSRPHTAYVISPGFRSDWVLGTAVDTEGHIYAVGHTTGDLTGQLSPNGIGDGDAYIVRFDPDLTNPVYRQLGTATGDEFREAVALPDGTVVAAGYSYGDFASAKLDPTGLTGDVILQRFSADFEPLNAAQLGTVGEERVKITAANGALYLTGYTEAAFTGEAQGSFDAFALAVDPETFAPVDASTLVSVGEAAALPVLAKAFPNPVSGDGLFTVEAPADWTGPTAAELYDATGRRVLSVADVRQGAALRLPGLSAGVYRLLLRTEGAAPATARITVQ